MNRFETHYYKTTRTKDLVMEGLRHGRYWIGIDDLIARIEAFPEQDMALSSRLEWAKRMKAHGDLFVISKPYLYGARAFELLSTVDPPALYYRHISKLWRDCK